MKTLLATILHSCCLIAALCLSQQHAEAEVRTEHTHLVLPAEADALRPLYDKIHALRQHEASVGEVNILHIGGSHVQAGTLSNTVRMHFQPEGDRGLLFPFRAIKTNAPIDYRFDYTGQWKGVRNVSKEPEAELGLSGAAAITSDQNASITLNTRNDGRWDYSQLILLGQSSDSTVVPYLTTQAGDTVWADPILSRIADVEGSWCYFLAQPDSLVTLHFQGLTRAIKEQPKPAARGKGKRRPAPKAPAYTPLADEHYFILRGLIPISPRHGITYTEAGVNGASVPSWLRTTQHFEQELSLLPPDLVVFGIGINDAHIPTKDFDPEVFKDNYRQLIARIRVASPDCRFLWITNNDTALRQGKGKKARMLPNKNGVRVRQAMMELATEFHGAVFDVFSLMGGEGSSAQWVREGLMQRDRIHFTREGYILIGDLLYQAIADDYARYYFD